MSANGQVTQFLRAWSAGDQTALEALVPLVEAELRRLARIYMARERRNHTLQATALVNEAFLRLNGARTIDWQDRAHFLGIAARLMRRVLVDHARERGMQKRGAGAIAVPLDEWTGASDAPSIDLLALDSALEQLALVDKRKCRVVDMRYFAGMTVEETAAALDVSTDTVKRDWRLAKLWLHRELGAQA
jgi:RNA polymerase sigma factor (TIGR02999 family)